MMPKAKYMKLSPAAKAKVKAALVLAGRGDYKVKRKSTARPRRTLRGRGDYWTGTGRTADPFDSAGARAGGAAFGAPGKYLGGAAHWLFKKLTGKGDYKVKSNSIMMGNDPPLFASGGRGMVAQHREFLGDIVTSPTASTFKIDTYSINAGQSETFPWLSTIANQYEQYCVRGMVFEFKSMSSDALNSVNTALGSVIMATQYNSVSPGFTSKTQMENHEFSSSAKSSTSFIHGIECAKNETPVGCLYTRQGDVPTGADKRLYDLGQFSIATTGFQGTSVNIGELWVTYDIELLKPQLPSEALEVSVPDHWQGTSTSHYMSNAVLNSGDTGTVASVDGVAFPVVPQKVQYLLMYTSSGGSATLTTALTTGFSGTVAPYAYFAGANPVLRTSAGVIDDVTFYMLAVTVDANDSAARVDFIGGTRPGGTNSWDLVVAQLPFESHLESKKTPLLSLEDGKDKDEDRDEDDEEDYESFLRWKKAQSKKEESKEPVSSSPPTPIPPIPETPKTPIRQLSKK